MNKKQNVQKDPLRHYMPPEMNEEVPEGFTSRVMSLVQLETVPARARNKYESLRIPVFSAFVTIVLVVLALLTGTKNETFRIPVPEVMKEVKFTFPDLTSFFHFNIPSTLIYVISGLLILTLFDTVLKIVFRREN